MKIDIERVAAWLNVVVVVILVTFGVWGAIVNQEAAVERARANHAILQRIDDRLSCLSLLPQPSDADQIKSCFKSP